MSNVFTNAFVNLTTTNNTTIYTCNSTARAIVQNIQLANESGNVDIKVFFTDSSASTTVEIGHDTIASKETVNLAKGPIVLEEGDAISITANATPITGIVSVLEINRGLSTG